MVNLYDQVTAESVCVNVNVSIKLIQKYICSFSVYSTMFISLAIRYQTEIHRCGGWPERTLSECSCYLVMLVKI